MTTEPDEALASLRAELSQLRRDSAKVVAAMQLGGQRKQRRELARQLEACRKRGKPLAPRVSALLEAATDEDVKAQLEKDASFLEMLRTFDPQTE